MPRDWSFVIVVGVGLVSASCASSPTRYGAPSPPRQPAPPTPADRPAARSSPSVSAAGIRAPRSSTPDPRRQLPPSSRSSKSRCRRPRRIRPGRRHRGRVDRQPEVRRKRTVYGLPYDVPIVLTLSVESHLTISTPRSRVASALAEPVGSGIAALMSTDLSARTWAPEDSRSSSSKSGFNPYAYSRSHAVGVCSS